MQQRALCLGQPLPAVKINTLLYVPIWLSASVHMVWRSGCQLSVLAAAESVMPTVKSLVPHAWSRHQVVSLFKAIHWAWRSHYIYNGRIHVEKSSWSEGLPRLSLDLISLLSMFWIEFPLIKKKKMSLQIFWFVMPACIGSRLSVCTHPC